MAHDDYGRLRGERIALAGEHGPFRHCPACGSQSGLIGGGAGPHLASLKCTDCGAHISWIGRAHLDALVTKMTGAV